MKKINFAICLMAVFNPFAAQASGVSNMTEYEITIAGFTLARASFETRIIDADFSIAGNFATTGLARAFKKWGGNASVSGTLGRGEFEAKKYTSNYDIGGAKRKFSVAFKQGTITEFARTPVRTDFPPEWVPVSKADLINIADPMTALIVPMSDNLCTGTVPVFDGETRMELKLSPKGEADYKRGRISTKAQVCNVEFSLKSGYLKGHTELEKLVGAKGFEVWLAKSPIANVYAPVQLRIPTPFGTAAISATRFGRVKSITR